MCVCVFDMRDAEELFCAREPALCHLFLSFSSFRTDSNLHFDFEWHLCIWWSIFFGYSLFVQLIAWFAHKYQTNLSAMSCSDKKKKLDYALFSRYVYKIDHRLIVIRISVRWRYYRFGPENIHPSIGSDSFETNNVYSILGHSFWLFPCINQFLLASYTRRFFSSTLHYGMYRWIL